MAEKAGSIYYTVDMETQPLIDAAQQAEQALNKVDKAMTGVDGAANTASRGLGKVRDASGRFVKQGTEAANVANKLGSGLRDAANDANGFTGKANPLAVAIRNIATAGGSALAGLGALATAAGVGAAAFTAMAAAAVAAGTALVVQVQTAAQEIQKFAFLANTTTTEFQRMAVAGQAFGLQMDQVGDILKDVNDKVGDYLATGAGELADFFQVIAPRVGVTAEQFRNLSGPDALQLYVNTLQRANVSQAEMTFYLESLANDATLLLPVLADNGAALRTLGDEAERAGAIMDAETIRASNELAAAQFLLQQAATGVGNELAAVLMPALTGVAVSLADFIVEAELAKNAAELLQGAINVLSRVAIGVAGGFEVAGKAIAGWASVAAAALTPGEDAAQAYRIANEDLRASVERLGAELEAVGNSDAPAKTEERIQAIVKAREALNRTGQQGTAGKNAKQLDEEAAAAKRAADAATKGAEDNAQALAGLREQLYQASLSGADLAARQAQLQLNKYATPEQIAQAQQLARELYAVRDAAQKLEQRKAAFGNDPMATIRGSVDPLSGGRFDDGTARYEAEKTAEAKRYADQQARMVEALELQLITKQQYQTLEEQLYAEHMARMNQIDQARRDAQLESWASGFGQMANDLQAFASVFADENSAMFKIAKAAAIAQTIIQTYQGAQAAFTSLASIPVVGPALGTAAAVAAVAGGLARVAQIRAQGSPAGRLYGGPVSAQQMYRVNENGAPEVFNAANGRQYMIPNQRGEVVSNRDATAPGGGGMTEYAPTVNQTIQVIGSVDRRTAAQIARATAERQQIVQARLGR